MKWVSKTSSGRLLHASTLFCSLGGFGSRVKYSLFIIKLQKWNVTESDCCLFDLFLLWKSHKKLSVFIAIFLPHSCNYNTYGNRTRKKGLIKKRCASRATSGAISKFLLQDTTRNEGEGHWTNCSLVHIMAFPVMEFQDQGYKIRKVFCIKINLPKGNYWILRIGLTGSLSSMQNSECLKLIILIFHVKNLKN